MNRVGLCRQDSLRFFLRDRGGKRLMRYGNMRRNIRDHFHSAMNILIQEVSAELRVKNATHKKNECNDQQNRDERDKQVANNQAVAQTPEQAISPPTEEADEEIYAGQDSQILQEAEHAPRGVEKRKNQSGGGSYRRNEIEPRKAMPDFFEAGAERCHRTMNGNNTLPEVPSSAEVKGGGGIGT